jgi:uncharacterized protein (TIGR02266 family)
MNLRFTCHVEGRALQAFSRDISMNGAFLKTDRNVMQGTHLRVEFALPGQQDEIGCGARVRNVVPPGSARGHTSGVGIEFEGIRDQDLQRLEDYIGRQGRHHRFR